jgi:eukaryotic-like serine/threonine-protein kinase
MTQTFSLVPAVVSEGNGAADVEASSVRRRESAFERFVAWLRELVHALQSLWSAQGLVGWLGPYRVSEKIGQGGMGVIYKATFPRSARPVAIKLLPTERASAEQRQRFRREARLTSLLRHPNTVSVFDFGKTRDGALYYVMEYLDGSDLQTLVESEGPQSPARVANMLAELAAALGEVHELGLIHGDVKPANVVCCTSEDGADRIKVLDFGLAREVGHGMNDSWAADSQEVLGTPLYLAPEALLDPRRVDARTDLYALGAVGYFLLTGTPPFSGKTALEVFTQHLHTEPVPPSVRLDAEIPAELESLILSCLAKAPEARPASAAALCRALCELRGRPNSAVVCA